MKIAKLYNFHDIKIEDAPVPEVGANEALMQVRASGICSGEAMPWYMRKRPPLFPGMNLPEKL